MNRIIKSGIALGCLLIISINTVKQLGNKENNAIHLCNKDYFEYEVV